MNLTIHRLLQLAIDAQSEGELIDAESYYKKVLKIAPNQPEAHHNLGQIKSASGHINDAITLFKNALMIKPDDEQYWVSYIEALIEGNQYLEAETQLLQASQLVTSSKVLDLLRRKILTESKLHGVSDSHPASAIQSTLREYYKAGRFREAEELARSVSVNSPALQYIWKYLGDILSVLGKHGEALDANLKAVELDRSDPEAHNNLGNTYRNLNNFDRAIKSYSVALKLRPDYADAYFNKGIALKMLSRYKDAEHNFRKALTYNSNDAEAYNNLGIILQLRGQLSGVEDCFKRAIALKQSYAEAHNNLGYFLRGQGRLDEACASCLQAISIKNDFAEAHSNLGLSLQEMGKLNEARDSCLKAIGFKPDLAEAHNNLGVTFSEMGRLEEAKACYIKASKLKEKYAEAYWNLSGVARNISDSKYWIDQCLDANPSHLRAKLTRAALKFYQGDKDNFDALAHSELGDHPYTRSFSWVFALPRLPQIFFNRWDFFDSMIMRANRSRPFYEFGVWRGASFRYLIRSIKKGYGFDTFVGLPEDWILGSATEKKGSYSSQGDIPEIEGAEFIVGEFKDTLPRYFSESRPIASIVNFDSDLYSSTLCALTFSKDIVDEETILIFDEFLINENWEEGEYKALVDFCSRNQRDYEVVAVSFFTKQVAVKLVETGNL